MPDALYQRLSPQRAHAFDAFRSAIRALVAKGAIQRRRAGTFAVEILEKRLLSCPISNHLNHGNLPMTKTAASATIVVEPRTIATCSWPL